MVTLHRGSTSSCRTPTWAENSAYFGSGHEVADLELHQIAALQLAVDRQVEQSMISEPLLAIKEEPDRPILLLGQ